MFATYNPRSPSSSNASYTYGTSRNVPRLPEAAKTAAVCPERTKNCRPESVIATTFIGGEPKPR